MVRPASIVLFAWELPQNALGACALALEVATGGAIAVSRERGRLFVESRRSAVSLGWFVFWARGANRWFVLDDSTRDHEYGHTFQSRWLGPLYLPVVGVPSVLRVVYAIAYRELTGTRWGGYFDGFPERWADRLGGVTRDYRAVLRNAS